MKRIKVRLICLLKNNLLIVFTVVLTIPLLQFRKKFIRGVAANTVSLPISKIELKRKRTTFCILEFPLGNNSIQPHVLVVDISGSIALQSSTPFFFF